MTNLEFVERIYASAKSVHHKVTSKNPYEKEEKSDIIRK